MDFKITINTDELQKQLGDGLIKAEQALVKSVESLALQTHAKIVEMVQTNLRSTRPIYIENLNLKQTSPTSWAVILDEKAIWIEEGKPAGTMLYDLLKNPTGINKKGEPYKVIPFKQNKAPTTMTTAGASLQQTLKDELKKINKIRKQAGESSIPLAKIEKNADGSPKLGLLHKFDVNVGPKGPTGIPYLHGIKIYQRLNEQGKAERFVGTFRVAKMSMAAEGRWFHPGIKPYMFFDKAKDWAEQQIDQKIIPEIIKAFSE